MEARYVELELSDGYDDLSLYNYIVDGIYRGQIEVQFDDGMFNDIIVYAGFDTENEHGEFEWVSVATDSKLYKMVRDKAIKDYNGG